MNGGKWFLDRTQFQTNSFVKRNKKNSYLLNSYHFHESKNNIKKVFIAFFSNKRWKEGFLTMAASLFCAAEFMCKRIDILKFYDSKRAFLPFWFYFHLVVLWKNFKFVYLALNFMNVCFGNLISKSSKCRNYFRLLSHQSPGMLYQIPTLTVFVFIRFRGNTRKWMKYQIISNTTTKHPEYN